SVAVVGFVGSTDLDQYIFAEAIYPVVVVTLRRSATIGVGDRCIPRSLPHERLGTEAMPMPPLHPSARQQLDQVAVSPGLQQAGQTDRRPDDMTTGWLLDPYASEQGAKPFRVFRHEQRTDGELGPAGQHTRGRRRPAEN